MIRMTEGVLLLGAFLVSILLFFFGNSQVFPLGITDFIFFSILAFFFALYRPGWAFLIFLALLPFEMVDISPGVLPLSLRPYQLLSGVILLSMGIRFATKRLPFPIMRFRWFDTLPIIFGIGGVLSISCSADVPSAAKQAVVVFSFVAIYFLSRQFLGGARDARRIVLFLVLSSVGTALFALWQSVRFTAGHAAFEVMPGRPNAFFSEPDWLGMFFILSGTIALALLFLDLTRNRVTEGEMLSGHLLSDRCRRTFRQSAVLLLSFAFLALSWTGILLTVARSAWVGFALSSFLFPMLLLWEDSWRLRSWQWTRMAKGYVIIALSFVAAILVIRGFRLTTFDLTDRAGSTASGQQEITVSCDTSGVLPKSIESVSELASYGCRFIRLEDMNAEQAAGKFVTTVFRPDPSIEARRAISQKTTEILVSHWLFGIGWGGIGNILGTDDRGASLNASNAFLEAWLGGGLISALSFLMLWTLVPLYALRRFFVSARESDQGSYRAIAVFFLLSWVGFTVFNLFNSGILLGFVWVWLGGIGIIAVREK
ncbi:MAG: O-antigen ligase family protein [Candidatus Moraniibacteriota bacterium]|nr:MAG: O-antigen ligase family protein [Candidatus Moranbacteria bacterium]